MAVALILFGLASVTRIYAQATTASIALLPEFSGEPLSGEIVGTGSDGTTFVISASGTNPGDVPYTVTAVQDATHISQGISVGPGLGENAQCTYDAQGVGACTIIVEGLGTGTETDAPPSTSIVSGTIPMIAVPVSTVLDASASATQSATQSAASSSSASTEPTTTSSGTSRRVATVGLTAIFSTVVMALLSV